MEMEQLARIIRYEVCGERGLPPEREITQDTVSLAKKHDLAHLVSDYTRKTGLKQENADADKALSLAKYRYVLQLHELSRVSYTLETNGIEFIVLKGAVIRKLYPEPWMRTSCDIDILIHEEDMQKTVELLGSTLDYEPVSECTHELALKSRSGVRIELHQILIEENRANNASELLERIWDYADGDGYQKHLRDEMYYYYHVAHMAKHFEKGGCGIRSFIDLWLLNHCTERDAEKRRELLRAGNLERFAEKAGELSEKWFSGTPNDEMDVFEQFVLSGGSYGTRSNHLAAEQQKKGSRLRYMLSRLFLPYAELKCRYPVLEKCALLYPLLLLIRLVECLSPGRRTRIKTELSLVKSNTPDKIDELSRLFESVGLDRT